MEALEEDERRVCGPGVTAGVDFGGEEGSSVELNSVREFTSHIRKYQRPGSSKPQQGMLWGGRKIMEREKDS